MAKVSQKTRSGRTVGIDPGEHETAEAAAAQLRSLIEANGGPHAPRQYTRRPVRAAAPPPAAAPASPVVINEPQPAPPSTIEERLNAELENRRQLAMAYLDFANVRWVWYTLAAAVRRNDERAAAGAGRQWTFGRFGIGQHLLVDPEQQASAAAYRSL